MVWSCVPVFALATLITLCSPYNYYIELLLYIYASIWNTIAVLHAYIFLSPLDAQSLYIIFHSGAGEIKNFFVFFFNFKIIFFFLVLWILPYIIWKLLRKSSYIFNFKQKISLLIIALLLMLLPMHDRISPLNGYQSEGIVISNIDENIRKLYYIELATYFPKMMLLNALNVAPPENVKSTFDGPQNIVLIITESSNRNQFSLYGYPRETTPNLDKMDNLIIYEDVISPSPVTSRSIPHMLTFSNLENNKQITTIYDLFEEAGFTSYCYNGLTGVDYTDIIHIINAQADQRQNMPNGDKKIFEDTIALLKEKTNEKHFVVIQTVVTHFPYTPFYPEDFEEYTDMPPNLFPGADKQQRNEYDTAIRYIDSLISEFLGEIKDLNNTLVLVTSDHGQEVASYSKTYGHSNSTTFLSCYEIPFYLYISNDYAKTLNKKIFDTKRPYQTDNLIHSLIDLSHIETDLFIPKYSIFNELYEIPVQKILGTPYLELKQRMNAERDKAFEKAKQ